MEVIKRPLGLYKANCYVLIKEGKSIIIDPGFHCNHIIDMVADSEPIAVLLTHGHCDLMCQPWMKCVYIIIFPLIYIL